MYCISISNKTSPASIRQLFSFSEQEKISFGKRILSNKQISGCVIVSTCNRSEIYFSGEKSAIEIVQKEACNYKDIDYREFIKYLNVFSEVGAIRHLFKVCCGLDSMVLGEDEILRQVKDSYQLSLNNKFTNSELNVAFQGGIGSAKLIKTETKLSTTPVSIGTLTANKIVEFLEHTKGSKVLIVGIKGKIGSIVAKNLNSKGCIDIIGTSRNHNTNGELFDKTQNVRIVDYYDRYKFIKEVDVIVSATSSPHYTFTYDEVNKFIEERNKRRLFIDLAIPFDIDKEVSKLRNVELIDIDYFEQASKYNNLAKLKEVDKVEVILELQIDETLKNIYFNEFYPKLDLLAEQIQKNGIKNMIYHFKENLSSEELKAVINSFQNFIE